MKDVTGKELKVGDIVATHHRGRLERLELARVLKLGPKKVTVQLLTWDNEYWANAVTVKFYKAVCLTGLKERDFTND